MSLVPPYIASTIPASAIAIQQPAASSAESADTNDDRPHLPCPPSSGPRSKPQASSLGMSLPSISTNVSDMLLTSLLPPNLPKLPTGTGRKGAGAPRELTTQREGLSVPLLSNNFRRFVTRVGPVFWLQDRIEEVLFWRKPVWTWAWMLTWGFICFNPRVLLLLPSLALIIALLHIHERTHPMPSLLGKCTPPPLATARVSPVHGPNESGTERKSFTATSTKNEQGETIGVPAVPPKEAESGVDYYMNIQAIQNLMGLVSDMYDQLAPRLISLQSPAPSPSPLNLPISHTQLLLLLLPPALFLPLTPTYLIPYLSLPMGILPPLAFHPNFIPFLLSLPTHPAFRRTRQTIEKWLMTDMLPDRFSGKKISQVYVYENERLDPKVAAAVSASTTWSLLFPPGSWSSRYLRQGDRHAWVKAALPETVWRSTDDLSVGTGAGGEAAVEDEETEEKVLGLKEGWDWVPMEEWRIDLGDWSEYGIDEEGWLYTDDSWQNPAATPYTEADLPSSTTGSTSSAAGGSGAYAGGMGQDGGMPNLGLRRVTRRRRWWKRVYKVDS